MISKDVVQYIANLSRIHLKNEEITGLTKNLEDILHYVEKLEKLDVSDVEPTSHVFAVTDVFREDKAKNPLSQKETLGITQNKHDGFFKVPKVIE